MARALLVDMVKDRGMSGRNSTPTAITAGLASFCRSGLIFSLLLSLLRLALPAQAGGTLIATGVSSDVAIKGPGYLLAHDPASGVLAVTRDGFLGLDTDGFLVTPSGMRVQGFADAALTTLGDLQIDAAGQPGTNNPPPSMVAYEIQTNGQIVVNLSDGTSFVRCQILLQSFQNPGALTQIWNNMFVWTGAAGALPQPVPPGSSGTGPLLSGYIEQWAPVLQLSVHAGSSNSFSQGFLADTANPNDVGIQGGGFLELRRTNDNALFATRAGAFYIDGAGYLVHYSGLRLQGYTNSALTSIGDLQMDAPGCPRTSNPTLFAEDFWVDAQGVMTEDLSDGSSIVRGQILLQDCSNPKSLTRASFDLYPIATNGGLWSPLAPPFTGDLGWLASGSLELSQLDTNLLAVRSNLNFFSQGLVIVTGVQANLAINGLGFFTVRDPAANIQYATRWGGFQLDAQGHLVTTNGLRLQGLDNTSLTQSGDIIIDTTGSPDPSLQMTNYVIDFQGNIYVTLSDGSQFLRGQILVQEYRNLQGLSPAGAGLYSNLTAALPVFTNGLSGYIQESGIQYGCVEQPTTLPALQLLPASGFHLAISDFPGGTVQASSDLQNWNAVGPIYSGVFNQAEYFDPSPETQKFYRLVLPLPPVITAPQPFDPVPVFVN